MNKKSKSSTKPQSSNIISETIRWKVVKLAHNLEDDMEVAKILLDCYDAVISGCLQWVKNSKKTRLPYHTSDTGWKLLKEITYMAEWKDRQEKKQVLSAWIDDDDDDVDDDDDDVDDDNDVDYDDDISDAGSEKNLTDVKKHAKVKDKKMVEQHDDHNLPDIQETDIDHVMDVDERDHQSKEDALIQGDRNEDCNSKSKKKSRKSEQKRRISTVQRLKNEKTRYAPTGYKKPGRSTKALEILHTPTQTKLLECKRCHDRFATVELFLKHYQGHTHAVIIGKEVRKVSHLVLDDIPCIATILIPCNECNIFTDNLELHQINKHFRRVCELCGDLFKSYGGWSRHMKTHRAKETGIKPHVCNVCGRGFALVGSLTTHRKLHSSERSFICEVCGKGFKIKARLQRHMPVHAAKSLSCEYCGKTFNYKFNLKTHLRTHTGERPFACRTCGKAYSHNSSLKAHAKSEHGIDMDFGCQKLVEFEDLLNSNQ